MESQPNPYSPPQAPVSDLEPLPTEKSAHVELACKLMWASFGFGILDSLWDILHAHSMIEVIGGIIGGLIGLGIGYVVVAWITRKWRAGRNWMRWLYTILNALSWLSIPVFWDFYRKSVFPLLKYDLVSGGSLLIQTIMGLAVLVLLHTPETRAWFRAHKLAV
jgi:hypothetical protein